MKIFRPGLRPMYVDEPEPAPVVKPAGPTQAELVKMAIASANARAAAAGLRQDGPTLKEYTDAGYDPATYPPAGFASKEPEAAPPPKPNTLFGANPTEIIPAVKPLPLVDNNTAPGDPEPAPPPAPPAPEPPAENDPTSPPPAPEPQVDPLLK